MKDDWHTAIMQKLYQDKLIKELIKDKKSLNNKKEINLMNKYKSFKIGYILRKKFWVFGSKMTNVTTLSMKMLTA